MVNAEVVTKSDLAAVTNIGTIVQSLYLQFPGFVQALLDTPEGKAFLDAYERQILNQLVDSRLLVQQAVLAGATADEAQVTTQADQQIQKIQSDNQITAEDMEQILVQQGSSLAEYTDRLRKTFRERAMVDRLHTKIIQDVTVSDAEIAAYYAEHQSEFAGSDGNVLPLDQGEGPDPPDAPCGGARATVGRLAHERPRPGDDRHPPLAAPRAGGPGATLSGRNGGKVTRREASCLFARPAARDNRHMDSVKTMIGGAPVTQNYADKIGADGYAPDAASAVDLAKSLIGK